MLQDLYFLCWTVLDVYLHCQFPVQLMCSLTPPTLRNPGPSPTASLGPPVGSGGVLRRDTSPSFAPDTPDTHATRRSVPTGSTGRRRALWGRRQTPSLLGGVLPPRVPPPPRPQVPRDVAHVDHPRPSTGPGPLPPVLGPTPTRRPRARPSWTCCRVCRGVRLAVPPRQTVPVAPAVGGLT